MFIPAALSILLAREAQGTRPALIRPQIKPGNLSPVLEMSQAQKLSFLKSKGLRVMSLSKPKLSLTFDPLHLFDKDSKSYLYVVGAVMPTESGWLGIEPNNHDTMLLTINDSGFKAGATSNYLVTVYGKSDDPLTVNLNDNQTYDIQKGQFSAPFVLQSKNGHDGAWFSVKNKAKIDPSYTPTLMVQKVTVELLGG